MRERIRSNVAEGDRSRVLEHLSEGTDPYLKDFLMLVDGGILSDKRQIVGVQAMAVLLSDYLGVKTNSIERVHSEARKAGVIEPKKSDHNGYVYENEEVLAFAAVCWIINKSFREDGLFDKTWIDIVEGAEEALGGKNSISRSLHFPQSSGLRFSTGKMSYEAFVSPIRHRESKYGSALGGERQEPVEPTPKEIIEDIKSWDAQRLQQLHESIPDSIDSIDSIPAMRLVPAHIVDTLMTVHDVFHRQDPDLRRVGVDPVPAALFKRALRDYLSLQEIFGHNGENYDMLSVLGAVRKMNNA